MTPFAQEVEAGLVTRWTRSCLSPWPVVLAALFVSSGGCTSGGNITEVDAAVSTKNDSAAGYWLLVIFCSNICLLPASYTLTITPSETTRLPLFE